MTFPTPNDYFQERKRYARLSTLAPRVPWEKFVTGLDWRQGEHFGLIGPTGQGKTNMLINLLPLRPFVVVFATKPKDETMEALASHGYKILREWQNLNPKKYSRRILWPDATSLDSDEIQKREFHDALLRIYREGGWTVAIDELWYIINVLGLQKDVKTFLLQGRSLGISLIMATQRPAWVPLEVYDQSTHLMFWRDNDETNLRRISGISYRSADLIRSIIPELDRHQVLYINTRTGEMMRTRPPHIIIEKKGKGK